MELEVEPLLLLAVAILLRRIRHICFEEVQQEGNEEEKKLCLVLESFSLFDFDSREKDQFVCLFECLPRNWGFTWVDLRGFTWAWA